MSAPLMSSESQPLSMMTIRAKRHDHNQLELPVNSRSDLLTIRVLESFERKTQMIKELLTPEEFNSLAPNLLISRSSTEDDSIRRSMNEELDNKMRKHLSDRLMSSSSYSNKSEGATNHLQQAPKRQQPLQQISKKSAKEHLLLKQQAIDFFFTNQPTHTRSATTHRDLAIELRSGYYLSSPSTDDESKLLRPSGFSVLDRVYAVLEMVGLSFKSWKSSSEEQDGGGESGEADGGLEFAEQSCDKGAPLLGWPYGRMRNIEAMRKRLQSDGQLEKVVAMKRIPRQVRKDQQGSRISSVAQQRYTEHLCLIDSQHHPSQLDPPLRLLEPVGHFIRMHIARPQTLGGRMYKWIESSLIGTGAEVDLRRSRMQLESSSTSCSERTLLQGSEIVHCIARDSFLLNRYMSYLELRLDELVLTGNTEFVSAEVTIALRLMQKWTEYCKQRGRLQRSVDKFVAAQANIGNNFGKGAKALRMKKDFEVVLGQCKRVTDLRLDLIAVSRELRSIRNEQEFNSTGVTIELIKTSGRIKDYDCALIESVEKLVENLKIVYNELLHKQLDDSEQVYGIYEMVIDFFEHCLERELELMQSSSKTNLYMIKLNPDGCQVTEKEKLPLQEQDRRSKLDRWLKSLRIQILIGREYYYNCDIRDCVQQSRAHALQIDLSDHVLIIPVPIEQDSIEIDLRLVQSTHSHSFASSANRPDLFGSFRVLGFAKINIGTRPDERISHGTTTLIDSEQHSVAVLRHRHQVKELRGSFYGHTYDLDMCRKIDLLYRRCFVLEHSHDNVETKIYRLMNLVDRHLLATLVREVFDGEEPPKEAFEKVTLNRFCSCLDATEDDSFIAGRSRMAIRKLKHPESDFSTRQSSSDWRLSTHLQSVPTTGSQVRDCATQIGDDSVGGRMDHKFRLIDLDPGELSKMGHKSIDLLRKRASEYVRQCERHIEQLVYTTTHSSLVGSDRSGLQIKDLLHEPQMRTMDYMWQVAQVAHKMVPKRSAPRPLKPKRKLAAKSSLRAAAAVALMATRRTDHLANDELDIESGRPTGESSRLSPGRRHRASEAALQVSSAGANLRLVVTIQQVTNNPLRVVRQSSLFGAGAGQSMAVRPSSPYPSAFGGAPGGTMSPQSRTLSPVPFGGYLLALPTTYVEAVFQRNRLATSLAYGKDPTWNETLFFPIESTGRIASGNRRRLVDEYLQLNLYDCQCHSAANTLSSTDSLVDETIAVSSGSTSQLVATQQRIERHLLGSLRVPLTTLLTSGRLEGSFALNQPLLLDNYQFEQETAAAAAQVMPRTLSPSPFQQQQQQQQSAGRSPNRSRQRQLLRHSQTTYLSLFITIDPPVSIPMRLYLPAAVCCSGSAYLEHFYLYCRLFEQVTSTLQSQRQRQQQRRRLRGPLKEQQQQHQRQQQPILKPIAINGIVATNRSLLSSRADRNVMAVCWNESAKLCLISAYLSPLELPADLTKRVVQINSIGGRQWTHRHLTLFKRLFYHTIARFVSLMSPLKYGLFEDRLLAPSLWFSGRHLLENMVGGSEEKAVLLCNYFLYLGRSSALLFGDSVPEGRCVYVIVWRDHLKHYHPTGIDVEPSDQGAEQIMHRLFPATNTGNESSQVSNNFLDRLPILIKPNTIEIWDPNSGKCYAIGSGSLSQLPLTSVGSIVTVENVYANVQTGEQPHDISFDIRLRRCWLPLLERGADRLQAATDQQQVMQSDMMDRSTKQLGGSLAGAEKLQQIGWRKQLAYLEQVRRCVDSQMLSPLMAPALSKSDLGDNLFEPMTRAQCDELRDSIERQVRLNLTSWRSDRPTYMNRALSQLISERLARFEQLLCRHSAIEDDIDDDDDGDSGDDAGTGDAATGDLYGGTGNGKESLDWRAQLAELLRNEVLALGPLDTAGTSASYQIDQLSFASGVQPRKKLVSFPVNLSYTNMSTLLDLLYASGVHNADLNVGGQSAADSSAGTGQVATGSASRTQFLIACHVEAYPARVLSVWLYVGAVVTMQ